MLQELTDWIATATGRAVGETLFAGWRPEDAPDLCTAVLNRVPAPRTTNGTEIDQRSIQFLTRGPSYFTAEAEAEAIHAALMTGRAAGYDLPTMKILTITGQSPAHLGQDSQGRHEFTFNLIFRTRNKET